MLDKISIYILVQKNMCLWWYYISLEYKSSFIESR